MVNGIIYAGGSTYSATDWKENDPSSPSYVKNRTHWLDLDVSSTQSLTTEENVENGQILVSDGDCIPSLGNIIFDGVAYENLKKRTLTTFYTVTYMGNPELSDAIDGEGGEDSNLPFLFIWDSEGNQTYLYVADNTVSHSVDLYSVSYDYHKIDSEYLSTKPWKLVGRVTGEAVLDYSCVYDDATEFLIEVLYDATSSTKLKSVFNARNDGTIQRLSGGYYYSAEFNSSICVTLNGSTKTIQLANGWNQITGDGSISAAVLTVYYR